MFDTTRFDSFRTPTTTNSFELPTAGLRFGAVQVAESFDTFVTQALQAEAARNQALATSAPASLVTMPTTTAAAAAATPKTAPPTPATVTTPPAVTIPPVQTSPQTFDMRHTIVGAGYTTPSATPPAAVSTPAPPAARVIRNATDAYWAAQPPEVQELRTIGDDTARRDKALELASRGFTIDNQIMVYGWDPYMTMKSRMEMGYTWMPAVGQGPLRSGPGLFFPGTPAYDASRPPAGSVPVNLDFARGFEPTDNAVTS
jgi:hypothetical protein